MALDRIGENRSVESETEVSAPAKACQRHWTNVVKLTLEAFPWAFATKQAPLASIDEQSVTLAGTAGGRTLWELPFGIGDPSQLEVVYINDVGAETVWAAPTNYTFTPAADGAPASITSGASLIADESVRLTVTTTRIGWQHVYALPADCVKPLALLANNTRIRLYGAKDRIPFDIQANDAKDGKVLLCDYSATQFQVLEYVCAFTYAPAFDAQFVDAVAWRLAAELAMALKADREERKACMRDFILAIDQAKVNDAEASHETQEIETPSVTARW
jgi:hypothetical protein